MSVYDTVAAFLFVMGVVLSLALLCRALWFTSALGRLIAAVSVAALLALRVAGEAGAGEEETFDRAEKHRRPLVAAVHNEHGLDGPVALHAGLIHQESRWRPDAESWAGAGGLAQIMPETEEHIEALTGIDGFDSYNPAHAVQGAAAYTAWIKGNLEGDPADPWPMVLSAYNGGLGLLREERAASEDPARWWGAVEEARKRGDAAYQENREYVRRIVLEWQPEYLHRGWPGPPVNLRGVDTDGR